MYYSKNFDIYFIEGNIPSTNIISHIDKEMHGLLSQSQLKTLDDVKKTLSIHIKGKNGNALINFKYGQKSSFFRSLISIDNISWYGSGDIVKLSDEQIKLFETKK